MIPHPTAVSAPARPSMPVLPPGPLPNRETLMSNRTTMAQLHGMDVTQASSLPIDQLALLLDEVGDLKAEAKRLGDLLNDALHHRFGAAAGNARRAEGKDTGRVRFEEGGFEIVADLPKRVEWDQAALAAAVGTIRAWGEDPADYVSTEIRVPETRFTAWPPKLQAVFTPARTVAAGRPGYALRRIEA